MKNRKIVIFGATGTIGAYASLYLKELGYDIIAVGKRKSDNGFFKKKNIKYLSIDITNKKDFDSLKNLKITSIIHCAGIMPARMKDYQPYRYIDSIITGTMNVLDFAKNLNVDKIIFTQTRADSSYLMGSKNPIPSDIERRFPLKGDHSIYTICKNSAVDMVEHYYHEYGLKRFVLRLPTIYAYHPNPFYYVNGVKKWMAYRLIIEKAKKGDVIEIWGNPQKEKEITYINDLLQFFNKCIQSDLDGGIYNVGRGIGVSLEEQILGIVEVFCNANNKSKIVYRPDMPDSRQFIHDISKSRKELGYEPQYDYMRLLKEFKKEMELNRFKMLWGEEKK